MAIAEHRYAASAVPARSCLPEMFAGLGAFHKRTSRRVILVLGGDTRAVARFRIAAPRCNFFRVSRSLGKFLRMRIYVDLR